MARIKILTAASSLVALHVVGFGKADIPVDGKFHKIDDALLPALDDSDVTYELENVAEGSSEPDPAAGGADGLGGSPAPLPLTEGETPSAGAEVREGANVHGLGPDTANGPNPDYIPNAEEQAAIDAAAAQGAADGAAAADAAPVPPVEAPAPPAPKDPLDHDANGAKGGSLPGVNATAAKTRKPRAKKTA